MIILVDGIEVDLKVGCDPEIFTKKDGELVSAHGLVPGDKENPFPVNKGAIQVDGMALEFNISPADNRAEFITSVEEVMKQLSERLPEGHTLDISSTANFGKDYIDSQPDIAKELGCMPDFNAYTNGAANPKPNAEAPYRTASGHIHVGWDSGLDISTHEHKELCCNVTQMMDLFLGVPSVLIDKDTQRRRLYGQAGSYRPKSYGLEYRVLSNFWLKSRDLKGWAYDQTALVIEKFLQGFELGRNHKSMIQGCINNSDTVRALTLMNHFGIQKPKGV